MHKVIFKNMLANVEVYLTNPAGIGEHSNIVEAPTQELDMIAKYQDQIDIIQNTLKSNDKWNPADMWVMTPKGVANLRDMNL